MDTRFWGPSGWKLLHLIAAKPGNEDTLKWFLLLPYVLPCKYCRASLQEYYAAKPLTLDLVKSSEFGHWLYEIHNLVNEKLRSQGLLNTPNPSWPRVRKEYETFKCGPMIGWDFLASVAYTTPTRGILSKPMESKPMESTSEYSMETRNRLNLLTRSERIAALRTWWSLIPTILPCSEWRSAWAACKPPPLSRGRDQVCCWLWDIETSVCSALRCPTPHPSEAVLRSEMSAFESACGSSSRRKTCRASRQRRRQAALTRRLQNQIGGVL